MLPYLTYPVPYTEKKTSKNVPVLSEKKTLKMFQVPFRGTSVDRGDSDLTFVTRDSDLALGTWTRER